MGTDGIEGNVDEGWGGVADAFAANFAERGEVGAAVAVHLDGRKVVDLWGGVADPSTGRPWAQDTVVGVFSSTKGVTAICKNERCDSLEILPGKLVVEIKPGGYDKGTGLREMMSVPPFTGRRPIFVGDDVTDNAAFAVLPDFGGAGFSVGGIVPGARFNFDGPQDVRRWLRRLNGKEQA